ncbi:hypothetical protein EYF80_051182 [Liparis tanakae]|uniref:Uncharacterized protein n=1 Tax=Liparis tanakae TaxID=230148 RepID=A0A4Z2FCM4_9TELE|nr:hypothetical protein EYF80_051182 [Liparis tanakae]
MIGTQFLLFSKHNEPRRRGDLPSPGRKVFRNRQMTARGKGMVGMAARRGPFFSLTSTTTPPPAMGAPAMALAPRCSPVFTRIWAFPPSFCAIFPSDLLLSVCLS